MVLVAKITEPLLIPGTTKAAVFVVKVSSFCEEITFKEYLPAAAIAFPAKLCHLKMGWNWLDYSFSQKPLRAPQSN